MAAAVTNYNAYCHSEWKWILGSFILPASRLDEFEEALAGVRASSSETQLTTWRLSVLIGPDAQSEMEQIRAFNARWASLRQPVSVTSVEAKAANVSEIVQLSKIVPSSFSTYIEMLPLDSRECIAAIADCGRSAKIRTGGETADKIPGSESVIDFIRLCDAANVRFKATAGLHHPLRSVHGLTYQPDSPSARMHGFINLFLAAAFMRSGMESKHAVRILEEESAEAFGFDAGGINWRQHRLSQQEIAAARHGFSISFGSCSFTEPIDDLRSLHLL